MSSIRIGISGWRYSPWRGEFYPQGLTQKRELEYASRAVSSIEINGSFYALQTPERYANWFNEVPDDFIFSIKGPRFITHTRRLRDIKEPVANFFASGLLQLKHKLGPILWQFPASFKMDKQLFSDFLTLLSRSTDSAVKLAEGCAERLKKPGYLDIDEPRPIRHAVEIRNAEGLDEELVDMLREQNIALVVADTAGKWPYQEDITSDFLYIRLHGDKQLYKSGYSDEALENWKQRIRTWSSGKQPSDAKLVGKRQEAPRNKRDIYCYFDNDVKVRAPFDAHALLDKLGLAKDIAVKPGTPLNDEHPSQESGAMQ